MNRRALFGLGIAGMVPLLAVKGPRENMMRWQAKTIDGETLTGESTKGKVVLIQAWATWCRYCQRDETALEQLMSLHAKDGLIIVAVNTGEPKKKVQEYLKGHPRTAKIVLVGDTNLGVLFGGTGLPAYILVDREGKVAATQEGSGGLLSLREMLKEVDLKR